MNVRSAALGSAARLSMSHASSPKASLGANALGPLLIGDLDMDARIGDGRYVHWRNDSVSWRFCEAQSGDQGDSGQRRRRCRRSSPTGPGRSGVRQVRIGDSGQEIAVPTLVLWLCCQLACRDTAKPGAADTYKSLLVRWAGKIFTPSLSHNATLLGIHSPFRTRNMPEQQYDAVILGAGGTCSDSDKRLGSFFRAVELWRDTWLISVLGLSIADELTQRGKKVAIIGRDLPEDIHSAAFASPWAVSHALPDFGPRSL